MVPARRPRSRSRLTLLLLVLVSITLLALGGTDGPLRPVRSAAETVLAPVGSAVGAVTGAIGDAWQGAFGGDDLAAENERLAQRVEELEGREASGEAARRELDQLASDLDLDAVGSLDTVIARVVSTGAGNFDTGIELDRGSNDGLRQGMPVMAGPGLVGRVVSVTADRAVVQPVSDPSFAVGVRIVGGPGLGVLEGQGSPTRALARSFDQDVAIAAGDLLVTSGTARSLYPPDLLVGEVLSVREDAVGLEQQAEVELAARVGELRYVSVILWEPKE